MATVRNYIPGSGYGNVYIDSLIWGGTAWDTTFEPIRVWFGDSWDYDIATDYHSGNDTEIISDAEDAWDWDAIEVSRFFDYATYLYEMVSGLRFEIAYSVEQADIVWWKTPIGDGVLGYHDTPDPDGGQIWGYFDPTTESWANSHFGGDGLNTIVHEMGHGLGLAHPHDGGSEWDATTFPGVPMGGASSIGDFGLNQGIWTIMSYNPGWDGAGYNVSGGNQAGLGAFDIAALQALYGPNYATAAGHDTYELPLGTTGWFCIWDAGGVDTITASPFSGGTVIDLRAATLADGDPNAGGFASSEDYVAGGYTIAYGVVIENAVGAGGPDNLIGNAAANTLTGNGGTDTLWGDSGNDVLAGGGGKDVFVFDARPNKTWNKDHIVDYSVSSDTIWLDNAAFPRLGKGSYDSPVKLKSDMFVKASRAKDRDDRIIYDSKKGVLYYDPDGTGKSKQIEFATLKKGLKMTHAEFFVV